MEPNFVTTRQLTIPKKSLLWMAIGTGSIFMALSQGSGELIWWPYIVGKYGLSFVFFLLPACLLQYPITYGICRYSILTGESIFRGFYRFNKLVTFVLWILFTFSFLWFGAYATAGATALAEFLPKAFSETKHNVYLWALITIAVYFSMLFIGRSVYSKIRKFMIFVSVVTILALIISLFQQQVLSQIWSVIKTTFIPASLPSNWDKNDSIRLLTAIMFAGLGGFWNLFNSYWILGEKAGLASDNPHEFEFDNGALPEIIESKSLSFWKRFTHMHVSIGILGNYLTTLMMCILAFTFLTPTGDVPYGWKLAVVQSKFFSGLTQYGPTAFLIIAALFLIDTWLTTLDAVSKIQVDVLRAYFPDKFKSITAKSMYYFLAIVILIITIVTMFMSPPETLLLINGFISAGAMALLITLVYFANFIVLQKSSLKKERVIQILLIITGIIYAILFVGYILVVS